MKNIYFVRHGQSEGNALRVYQSASIPLSELGHEQAQQIASRFNNISADLLISSPYVRAYETAEYISKTVNLPIEKNELFRERKRPSIQEERSKELEELKAIDKVIADNWEISDYRHSDEENFEDLKQRAKKAFEFIESREEDNIIIVTHKNFLHCLIWYRLFDFNVTPREAKIITDNFVMSNTGIVWMQFDEIKKDWKIVTWNDHAHLG
jgi:broad specificity phosphatase PhoE